MAEEYGFIINKETQLQYAMKCLENNPDSVFWCDYDGNVVYVNNAACKELGYSREEMLQKKVTDFDINIAPGDLGPNGKFICSTPDGTVTRFRTWHKHRDGHSFPVEIAIGTLEAENNSLGFSFVRNISSHIDVENKIKEAYLNLEKNNYELSKLYQDLSSRETQLKYLAYHDTLTGLPNRACLTESIGNIIHINKKFAILMIDLDNFKNINDGLGHRIGDFALIEVASRMSDSLNDKAAAFRFGGDEFFVLIEDINSIEDIQYYTEKIRNCLSTPFSSKMISFYLTCSIGVSIFPDDATTAEDLLTNADVSMYKAKMSGKNSVCFFNSQMKKEANDKIDLQNKLRIALSEHQFYLQYQPQYNLKTGKIRGMEALIRCSDPYFSNIGPNIFIPVAEEIGLIFKIGEMVLKNACTDACKWIKQYGYNGCICVNISAKQLIHVDFVRTVKEIIHMSGLDPKHLELEITESLFIDSFDAAVSKLMELKELGICICLDDFGTGYSSLAYLLRLPIDTLKIDKSFIEEIDFDSAKRNLTGSIVSLVNNLGIETIAEGVETTEQFDFVVNVGTNYVQGYLLSEPVMKEDAGIVIQKDNQGILFNGRITRSAQYMK